MLLAGSGGGVLEGHLVAMLPAETMRFTISHESRTNLCAGGVLPVVVLSCCLFESPPTCLSA